MSSVPANNSDPITQRHTLPSWWNDPHRRMAWIQSIVGRDWEIFWRQTTTEDDDVDDEDWYEGRIVSFHDNVFAVKFMGDDMVYQMHLLPSYIRPSARAWVQNTKMLEAYQIPISDTRQLSDEPFIANLHDGSNAFCIAIRIQIYLRSRLTLSHGEEDDAPTDELVNQLTARLIAMEEAVTLEFAFDNVFGKLETCRKLVLRLQKPETRKRRRADFTAGWLDNTQEIDDSVNIDEFLNFCYYCLEPSGFYQHFCNILVAFATKVQPYVKFTQARPSSLAELEALLQTAEHLREFDIAKPLGVLTAKIAAVSQLQSKAAVVLPTVLDEESAITALVDDSSSKLLKDIDDFGNGLTRKLLLNAAAYHEWYLDLVASERNRQRVRFMESVAARLTQLPKLVWGNTDMSVKLAELAPRVRDLSKRYTFSFCQHSPDVGSSRQEYFDALQKLGDYPAISFEEEFLAVKLDMIVWSESAAQFTQEPGDFATLQRLKTELEELEAGKSSIRQAIVANVRPDAFVDKLVQDAATAGLAANRSLVAIKTQIFDLFELHNKRKTETNAILARMKDEGVKLEEIGDFLGGYTNTGSIAIAEFNELVKQFDDAAEWSSRVSKVLSDSSTSFEQLLLSLDRISGQRPQGIVTEPSASVVDSITDLLRWYAGVKGSVLSQERRLEDINKFLAKGSQVIELFCKNTGYQIPNQELLRSSSVGISILKLRSSASSTAILERMTNPTRDEREGSPMLFLQLASWGVAVREFLTTTTHSLTEAKALRNAEPKGAKAMFGAKYMDNLYAVFDVSVLVEKIRKAEAVEARVADLINTSKLALDSAAAHDSDRHKHADRLDSIMKEIQGSGLSLGQDLQEQVGQLQKTFSWIAQATELFEAAKSSSRMPWTILVQLQQQAPSVQAGQKGSYSELVFEVKQLFDAAQQWQGDVALATNLMVYGGSRRLLADQEQATMELDDVKRLLNHSSLAKVVMPREDEVKLMLLHTLKFEKQLYTLLDMEFKNESLHRPDSNSLIDEEGTFPLLLLTGSELFSSLGVSLTKLSDLLPNILAKAPGKVVVYWVCEIYKWVAALQREVKSTSAQMAQLSRLAASSLLDQGRKLLLHTPEGMPEALSRHGIDITVVHNSFDCTFRTEGAMHSAGGTLIGWCSYLLKALELDLKQLDQWNMLVTNVSQQYSTLQRSHAGKPLNDVGVLSEILGCQADIVSVLEDAEALVVAPRPDVYSAMGALLTSMNCLVNGNPALSDATRLFAQKRYSSQEAASENRHDLLDCLIDRLEALKNASTDPPAVMEEEESKNMPFRDAGRKVAADALKKGMALVGVDDKELECFASVRAWDIEGALFNKFQQKLGESKISNEYRSKARDIRRSLEDPCNLSLCLDVLLGNVKAEALVEMSTEDLANPEAKKSRAEMEEKAKNWSRLDAPSACASAAADAQAPTADAVSNDVPAPAAAAPVVADSTAGTTSAASSLPAASSPIAKRPVVPGHDNAPPSPFGANAPAKKGRKLKDLVKAKTRGPPPPPPALVAMSLKPESSDAIKCRDGEEEFFFSSGKHNFSFTLHVEIDSQNDCDRYLSQSLTEKGGVRYEEGKDFFEKKLHSGRYVLAALRISVTRKSGSYYKKYYKDMESKKKVSCCNAGKTTTYILTPKSHGILMPEVKLSRSTSSYLVFLQQKH